MLAAWGMLIIVSRQWSDMIEANTNHGCKQSAQQLAQQVLEWVTSPQGQQVLSQTVQDAVRETDRLRQARQVDPKTLHEPVTL